MMSGRRPALRVAGWLGIGLTLLYLGATGGHVYTPDGVVMARVSEALVERGTLAVSDPGYPPGFLAQGVDGRAYGKYGLGLSLWAVPFQLAGRALASVAPAGSERVFIGPRFLWYDPGNRSEAFGMFGVALANAPLVAATCALLYLLARELGLSARLGLIAAGLAGLASPLPVYAKDLFAEPLAGCGLMASAWGLARWWRAGGAPEAPYAALVGGGLGVAVLAKPAMLVVLPVLVLAAALAMARPVDGRGAVTVPRRRPVVLSLLAFAAPLLAALALVAAANLARFGHPLATGYGEELELWTTPWRTGLMGLLLSPGRGLLPYFPLAVLALAGSARLGSRAPWFLVWAWGGTAALLLLHARWHGWDGGWCWGPRFLVPAIAPLCLLAAVPLVEKGVAPVTRWGGWAIAALSAVIAWTGTLVPATEYHHLLRQVVGPQAYLEVARWSWAVFPPRVYWSLPKTYWLLPTAARTPEAAWLALALAISLLLGTFALLRAWSLRRPSP